MTTPSSTLWTSKLGNKYPKEEIERSHDKFMKELIELRRIDGNDVCADCGDRGTVWSSVNLGVFLCLRCGSLHRAMGTHISKPKGTTGTYLWGQDEMDNMKAIGNARANEIYGGINERPSSDAPSSEWLGYLRQKYEERKFAPPHRVGAVVETNDEDPRVSNTQQESNDVPTANLLDLPAKECFDTNDFFGEFGV